MTDYWLIILFYGIKVCDENKLKFCKSTTTSTIIYIRTNFLILVVIIIRSFCPPTFFKCLPIRINIREFRFAFRPSLNVYRSIREFRTEPLIFKCWYVDLYLDFFFHYFLILRSYCSSCFHWVRVCSIQIRDWTHNN